MNENQDNFPTNMDEIIDKIKELRFMGAYEKCNDYIEDMSTSLSQANLSHESIAFFTLEMARNNYIFGHFPLALSLYERALSEFAQANCLDMNGKNSLADEYQQAKNTLAHEEQGKVYPHYHDFRCTIDHYYQINGDFNRPLQDLMTHFLEEMGMQLIQGEQGCSVEKVLNNCYSIRFVTDEMFLILEYEKQGSMFDNTQLRVPFMFIKEEHRGKGYCKAVLNTLFAFAQARREDLVVIVKENASYAQYFQEKYGNLLNAVPEKDFYYFQMIKSFPGVQSSPKAEEFATQLLPMPSKPQNPFYIWTVQKNIVIDFIMKEGSFQPSFEKSDTVANRPEMRDLYGVMLENFNHLNGFDLPGLLFGYMNTDGSHVLSFGSYEELTHILREKRSAIQTQWEYYQNAPEEYSLVKVAIPSTYEPMPIDVNDYNYLIPPIEPKPPFNKDDLAKILHNLRHGKVRMSPLPSGLMQVHMPFLKKEYIQELHPLFDLKD